jgi:1-acyl-sn-glycerol-3-phosphate acyltransferase
MIGSLRAIAKLGAFLWVSGRALLDFWLNVRPRGATRPMRADWCHRWAIAFLKVVNVELTFRGVPPKAGILACNHLSYVDVVVLHAIHHQVFLSKAEVRDWPIIGPLTRCGGTLFVRRERKADVADLQTDFMHVLNEGIPITIFPEGTSSDGSTVLPFRSSFLEPAAKANCPVTPAWIGYRLDEGSVADEVCYWRDMTFGPHFLKLLSKKKLYATVVFGEPIASGMNRKEMAAALHAEVTKLANRKRTGSDTLEFKGSALSSIAS